MAAKGNAGDEDGRRIPVTVLTGFLGSGKTTLLNHILQNPDHGLRFAIIENEFGDISVDDKVLQEACDEEVVEVMNGCICCTVRGDLVAALKRLHAKIAKFDAVIIETTGLADPAPVAQTFFVDQEIEKMYRLDGICTVVDAKHIMQHLDEEKPEGVENEAVEQLAFADRILLNKVDLIQEDKNIKNKEAALKKIETRIKAINSGAPIFRCTNSNVNCKDIIEDGDDHHHDDSVTSCSSKFVGELNHTKLNMYIERLIGDVQQAKDLFRYKGVLAVRGMQKKYVFQGVHMVFSGGFVDIDWKPGEARDCRFVFIGRNLDKEALIEGFEECKVWGPIDDDRMVRAAKRGKMPDKKSSSSSSTTTTTKEPPKTTPPAKKTIEKKKETVTANLRKSTRAKK